MRYRRLILQKGTWEAAAQFILQTQYYTDNPQNICEEVIINALKSCSKELSHCKNKQVVVTTEWLPWLQTSYRYGGHEG